MIKITIKSWRMSEERQPRHLQWARGVNGSHSVVDEGGAGAESWGRVWFCGSND